MLQCSQYLVAAPCLLQCQMALPAEGSMMMLPHQICILLLVLCNFQWLMTAHAILKQHASLISPPLYLRHNDVSTLLSLVFGWHGSHAVVHLPQGRRRHIWHPSSCSSAGHDTTQCCHPVPGSWPISSLRHQKAAVNCTDASSIV